jgi:hypothetical protein
LTVYRNQGFSQLLTLVAAVFAAGSVVLAISRSEATTAGRWAPAAVVIAISAFCYLRLARAGVHVEEDGIRVVNPFRTVRVPWEHLVRFVSRPHKGFPALGFAQRIDGTEVELWGIQARGTGVPAKRVVGDLVESLNEELASARTRARVDPPPAGP